jgi:hypothetical protein
LQNKIAYADLIAFAELRSVIERSIVDFCFGVGLAFADPRKAVFFDQHRVVRANPVAMNHYLAILRGTNRQRAFAQQVAAAFDTATINQYLTHMV